MLRNIGILVGFLAVVANMFVLYATANSQDIIHSIAVSPVDSLSLSSLSFNRVLNTYVWSGNLQKEIHNQIWKMDVRQYVRSRLIITNQTAIQDEYQGLISLRARLSEDWNVRLQNTSNVLADNRIIDLGRMAQHRVLGGFGYNPEEDITGEALGGFEINTQEEESDKGFSYAIGFDANRIKLEEFVASLRSSWNQSLLGRRSPRNGNVKLILLRDFGGGVDDSLTVSYYTQRREFYTSLDDSGRVALGVQHNIFQRDASVLEVMNQTKYNIGDDFSLIATAGLSNRLIDRGYRLKNYQHPKSLILDSHIQEVQFFGSISLQWSAANWLNTDARLSYVEKEERHSVKEDPRVSTDLVDEQRRSVSRLENTAQHTMLSVGVTAMVTENDRIRLASSASILRYDTPDTLNTDDRDELLLTSGIEVLHRFSPRLTLTLSADLTLFHRVYLHRNQSANNNWNRIVRLSPVIEYERAPWFRTVIRTEVLANYTISDYEEQAASIRSFSFRQVLWADSTIVHLSKRIQCNFSGSLRIFERGILRWKEFKERPEEYFIEKALWPEIICLAAQGLKVGIGYRYFGQDRYKYEGGNRVFVQGVEALGPTAVIEWSGSGAAKVTVSGWREEQKSNGTSTATISNLSIQIGFTL